MQQPLDLYEKRGVPVHLLAGQLWCEQEVDLRLHTDIEPELSEEVKEGQRIHRELHEAVADLVPIRPRTREDHYYVLFYNVFVNALRLRKRKRVRELPIFGSISSLPIQGLIDEVRPKGRGFRMVETKTRRSNRPPSPPQLRRDKFQTVLYWLLLQDIATGRFTGKDFRRRWELQPSNVTDAFLDELQEKMKGFPRVGLKDLIRASFRGLRRELPLSNIIELRYIFQETGGLIKRYSFEYDASNFEKDMEFVAGYWLGERAAIPVGKRNEWKCNYCDYRSVCPKWNQ